MPGKKECNRSVAEWGAWAKAEGFVDIREEGPNGVNCPGKVYYNLCAVIRGKLQDHQAALLGLQGGEGRNYNFR